jgi:hypothetical protein
VPRASRSATMGNAHFARTTSEPSRRVLDNRKGLRWAKLGFRIAGSL